VAKRGVRFVLGFIVLAVLISVAGVVLMYLAVGRAPPSPATPRSSSAWTTT
jgi:ABC-type transporter Mla subunit MlaD